MLENNVESKTISFTVLKFHGFTQKIKNFKQRILFKNLFEIKFFLNIINSCQNSIQYIKWSSLVPL